MSPSTSLGFAAGGDVRPSSHTTSASPPIHWHGPVAALFESGEAKLAGSFAELEDQLCGLAVGGGYEGPGRSPDRADAMIYALSELMLRPHQAEPRLRTL